MLPPPLKNLADLLTTLPSIGPRQAMRLAFYIVNLGKSRIADFATAFQHIADVKPCAQCFFIHNNAGGFCSICANPNRRSDVIAIVEKETDLISLERSKRFDGCYLVLGELKRGGVLDELQTLKLNHLRSRVQKLPNHVAHEIILAISPTTSGDLSAAVIVQSLQNVATRFTRLGRGLPTGGEIEFADEETLAQAFDNRG